MTERHGRGTPGAGRVPRRVLAHVRTWRVYESASYGLLGLVGAYTTGSAPGTPLLVSVWALCTLGGIGGAYLGDYLGRDGDALAKPHRPIPSGALSARRARTTAALCVTVAAIGGLAHNWRSLIALAVAYGLHMAYHHRLKAYGLVGDLVEGMATLGGLVLWGAMVAHPSWPPPAVWLVACAAGLHGTLYNVLLTLTDPEGDRRAGWRTLPVRHGVRATLLVATVVEACWILAVVLTWSSGHATTPARAAATGLLLGAALVCDIGALRVSLERRGALRPWHALDAAQRNLLARVLACSAFLAHLADPGPLALAAGATVLVAACNRRHLIARYELGPAHAGPALAGSGRRRRRRG
ncbi:UbiA family prenyltransferase [Streptomyces sp. NPDC051217]|uniref:UbiA family prenyltransferase n=1 Tax=Streptomyces sp. NPDC051217 TaxID=3365644 RepID=UPI0037965813